MRQTWKMIVPLFFLLTGCISATPYKQMKQGYSCCGYRDQHLTDNIYMITFNGNMETDRSTVTAYAYRRAEEVCKENGYRKFEVLGEVHSSDYAGYPPREFPELSLKVGCKK